MRAGVGEVANGVTDRVPDAVSRSLVDDDLIRTARGSPIFQRDSLQTPLANVGEAECRAARGGDDVAVLIEELCETRERGLDDLDAVNTSQIVSDRCIDRISAPVALEGFGGTNFKVDL